MCEKEATQEKGDEMYGFVRCDVYEWGQIMCVMCHQLCLAGIATMGYWGL